MKKIAHHNDRLPLYSRLFLYACVGFVVVAMGLPMLNVLAVSFSEAAKSETPGLVLFPRPFTLEGYNFIWNYINLYKPFFSTLYVSATGTALHIFLAALAGFVLMHKELPYGKYLTTFVMLTMTVPNELTLVSLYEVNKQMGLINTYTALIINGAVSGMSILLMRNFFTGVPRSLLEASRIDGASDFTIFRKVYLPLSVSGAMTVGTLELIRRWNSITITVSLISSMDKWTLPVMLRWILFQQSSASGSAYVFANAKMAAVALTAVPLVIIYFFTQRFFHTGVLLGSTKE
jgi:putative aldouronate transport system permease protein